MADIDSYLSSSIDDYLLSIAEGIRLAQSRLDRLQANPGGASWSYYLPKLEFELKMTVEMVESKTISAKLGGDRLRPSEDRHLVLRPLQPSPSAQTQQIQVEAASVIRGTFVAVPANAGRPALLLRSHITKIAPNELEVGVELLDSAGGKQAGLEVHFNLDREASRSASAAKGLDIELAPDTYLSEGVVVSDAEGRATSTLVLAANEVAGRIVVISLDVATRSEQVHYEVEF